MKYTVLHAHSDASLLDGLSNTKELAQRYYDIGATGGALTDHGTISNSIAFLKAMKEFKVGDEKHPLKPIIGIELYISQDHASIQTAENRKCLHLVVLCKNTQGWKQLLKIVQESNKPEHYYYKPRLSLEQLAEFAGNNNLIAFSGHLGSNVADSIMEFGKEAGKKTALYLQDIFGKGNFWLECQLMDRQHNPEQIKVTDIVREISLETGIHCIATPDAHYARKEDASLQRILLCSNMGTNMKKAMEPDFQMRGFFISDNFHVPTYDEMVAYGHTKEELENTNKILDQIEEYEILQTPQLPSFDCPNNLTEIEYLTQICRDGWKELIMGRVPDEKLQEYADRVKYELEVIKDNNLAGYFLIIWDIMEFCKKQNIMTGPGRGSAAGCIVSYLMGITKVDSIKYNLLFERFYNAGRAGSMPDIDSDFEVMHRDEVFEYIRNKYGETHVSNIMTYQNMKGARAIKETFRAYGDIPYEEINRITQNIIPEHKIADELQEMEDIEEGSSSIIRWCLENRKNQFKEWCEIDEEGNLSGPYADRFKEAIQLEGIKSAQSKHPCGVVVSKNETSDVCPMVLDTKTDRLIGGLTMNDMESIGLVKMDILSLACLDKLSMVARLNPKFNTDFNKLDYYDDKSWELFGSGKTKGCFQLETRFGQQSSKKLKPTSEEHLGALSAILRPGCLESLLEDGKSVTDHYILRKNNQEEPTYTHPILKAVLEDTYGLLIYQEQSMKIAQLIAGFDLKQADALRKAIGKKIPALMVKVEKEFMDGVIKTGIVTEEVGRLIFDGIKKSQRYAFNKSHSISYAMLSYMCGYAKVHFPLEFYTSFLAFAHREMNPAQEVYELVNDAKNFGIYVQPPNVRLMNPHFALIDGKIYYGIVDIKNVGESVVDILKENEYWVNINWECFLTKVSPSIKKDAMEALINSGALDCYGMSRTEMFFQYSLWKELTKKEIISINLVFDPQISLRTKLNHLVSTGVNRKLGCSNKNRLSAIEGLLKSMDNPPYPLVDKPHQIAQLENQLLGVCLTASFLDESSSKYMANCTCAEFNDGFQSRNGYISIAVQIDAIKENMIKKGPSKDQMMAFLSCSDESSSCDSIVAFAEAYEKFREVLIEGNRVLLSGKRTKTGSLGIEEVRQI